ncbi:MAG: hypothetical protein AAB664_03645, partial [Patescibacteria group bacterium]
MEDIMDTIKTREALLPLFETWREEANRCHQFNWHKLESYVPLVAFLRKNRESSVRTLIEGNHSTIDSGKSHLITYPELVAFLLYACGFKNLPI